MVQEVVQTQTGQLDVHLDTGVVYRLEHGVETSQWLLTKKVGQVTGVVTVLVRLQVENHQAPFLTSGGVEQLMEQCWSRCGCWTAPYATGGQGAMTTYCGRCCGQGGQGGSGVVRITYV